MNASTTAGPTDAVNYSANSQTPPHMASLRSLFLIAVHNGVELAPEVLTRYDGGELDRFMLEALRKIEMRCKIARGQNWNAIIGMGSAFPVLAELKGGFWVIVASAHRQTDGGTLIAVLDPRIEPEALKLLDRDEFERDWTGRVLLCKRSFRLTDEARPFGFAWFMPEILKNRKFLRDVAIAATMSNLISFATPLFFNVMIDKVIPHRSYNSLVAIALAYVVCTGFDAVFNFLRHSLMLVAGNKIDARLAERTFQHLLRLPMNFFETTPAGVLIRNMQQTEGVRGFLTGSLFQTLLDASGLPLLLVGLSLFSGTLTMVVLCFALAIAAFIGLLLPTFRRQLEGLYEAEAGRQANLVETVHGMRAVKSLGLESIRKAAWDSAVARSVRKRFTVGQFGIISLVVVTALQSLMQLAILGVGSMQVFDGSLSLGALIAFNMLSGRVTGPLVQMVHLINEYQQTALSVRMLGRVMDHPPERPPGQKGIKPVITGQLELSGVTFTYDGAVTPALDDVGFAVEAGQMIGIVGRSGSGKTTITRLMQGIQTAQQGLIKLDGTDLRHIDLAHLRRNIGVVLQDNILFRGTIRENIAAARPDASLDEVMAAARLSGADEFIERLPLSYETFVEESATNYSGGQRQRIAIARALLPQPRMLIFDEATSALDPESEAIVQQNLESIAANRTTIIVSHRLSSLVKSDMILVLERGAVLDYAPHAVLLERCEVYRQLWETQTRYLS
jgi:ATP-binding cassette subfamily B protein